MNPATHPDAKSPEYAVQLWSLLYDQYALGKTVGWQTLAKRFTEVTNLDSVSDMKPLFAAVEELNDLYKKHMVSTCVVGQGDMPGNGFFASAAKCGLLDPNASTEQKMEFWRSNFRFFVVKVQRLTESDGPDLARQTMREHLENKLKALHTQSQQQPVRL